MFYLKTFAKMLFTLLLNFQWLWLSYEDDILACSDLISLIFTFLLSVSQELNRVRRAAISLGFISLVDGLAAILERECTLLPGGAHPDCALQLTHAANVLRKPYSRDPKYNVLPMRTRFQDGDSW